MLYINAPLRSKRAKIMIKFNFCKLTNFFVITILSFIFLSLFMIPSIEAKTKTQVKSAAKSHLKSAAKPKALKQINPTVLALATKAHRKAQAMGVARKPLLTIIDYSLPSTQPRLWVVDTLNNKIIYHTYVAHGSGSGDNHAKRFSDVPGSYQSSLGVFVTGKTYQGKHGLSLTLHGLEQGVNGNAERRRIVMHGANYVNTGIIQSMGRLGRSWGCPAVSTNLATPMIKAIKDGSVIFSYYPDNKWLKRSKFLS